jgi:hypothetical protein
VGQISSFKTRWLSFWINSGPEWLQIPGSVLSWLVATIFQCIALCFLQTFKLAQKHKYFTPEDWDVLKAAMIRSYGICNNSQKLEKVWFSSWFRQSLQRLN